MTTNYLRVLCLVAGLQAAAMAQAGWVQVASTGPSARCGHAMAYDSQRGRTVLFGGSDSACFGDTWEWDGNTWMQVPISGPSPRTSPGMVYDNQRGRIVLFGGFDYSSNSFLGDTWEYDGTTWLQRAAYGPVRRFGHAMAYDSQRGRTVMFGGFGGPYGGWGYFGDTWEWNGQSWIQAASTGPSIRVFSAMAYNPHRGRTVLFSGDNSIPPWTNDTWEWDGNVWTLVSTAGPTARAEHAMAYDTQRGRMLLFGGTFNGFFGDTWELVGTTWALVAPSGPSARYLSPLAYDSARGRTVMFGGADSGFLGDTWEWGVLAPSTGTSFGTGCGAPALALSPAPNARPLINATAQASLTNIPSSLAFVALGWSNTAAGPFPLPLSLVWYGMPGCYMLQSTEAAAQPVTFTGPTTATYSLPLPNWSGLIGLHIYLQGWANAPGANAAGVIVSNGVEWVIGNS